MVVLSQDAAPRSQADSLGSLLAEALADIDDLPLTYPAACPPIRLPLFCAP